ncbi:hypothetical protein BI291_15885 [Thalassotalea sp. PP2-459]|nr:hypothetical protein BI291_15885 [Thalassotalea sp. PP2-459]
MNVIKWAMVTAILLCTGCSSTEPQVRYIDKKPLVSDHELMMSLLDRPITTDQRIMLAFANYQTELQHTLDTTTFVRPISITGTSSSKQSNYIPNYYQTLIANDINATVIRGPE